MKVYVGWNSREDIAYQVCEHSIKRRDQKQWQITNIVKLRVAGMEDADIK